LFADNLLIDVSMINLKLDKPDLLYYQFGPFVLSMPDRLLHFGDQVVPLTPKLIDTLAVLVESRGHVVTKQELMDKLWPDSFVEESSLTQNISLLRRALADYAENEQYIETIPKRGYRFTAQVSQVDPPPTTLVMQERTAVDISVEEPVEEIELSALRSMRRRSWKRPVAIAGILALLVAGAAYLISRRDRAIVKSSEINSLAVLPFKTLGKETDDPIGLGIANSIILRLSKGGRPYTLPTNTIYKYTDSSRDVLSIGRELGVDGVLDGTVQRSEGRIRVTAQLLRVRDGKTLWVGKFDEDFNNIFQVQDAISERLAQTLVPEISRDSQQAKLGFTRNADAYQSYSLGLHFFSKGSGDIIRSIPHFEQATMQDPEFAVAHASLAHAYYYNAATDGRWAKFLGIAVPSHDESLRLARQSLARALSLDPNIAEAHSVMAGLKTLDRDYAGAEVEYKRALELNPNYAIGHNLYGVFLFHMSDIEGAVSQLRQAQALNPASPVTNIALANMLLYDRKYDEAVHYAARALQLEPTDDGGRLILGEAYYLKGSYQDATQTFQDIIKNPSSPFINSAKGDLAIVYASNGRVAEARKLVGELLSLKNKDRFGYYFAIIYAALGEETKAIEFLEKERQTRYNSARFKLDPYLDRLRNAPRFKTLLERPPAEEYQ
jgi:DNA-binding winged helix-turn-helix (wHTH) protein/TolB-like protein/Flp pilus assembly protein TadD